MTAISARKLRLATPGGETLIDSLDLELPRALHGLVGRNGAGKSLLARTLAGERPVASGTVVHHVPVGFLPQQPRRETATVAEALGLAPKLAALSRIEAGELDPDDFDRLEGDWLFRDRWQQTLAEARLPTDFERDAATLSGGELTRLHLLRLFADPACYLILDEPGNHLDRDARRWLRRQLENHPGGALVVSHSSELLDGATAIHALSATGMVSHGGNYAHYRVASDEARQAEQHQHEQARRTLHKARQEQQLARERQQKRQQRGEGRSGNLPRLLLGLRRQQAEQTASRMQQVHAQRIEAARTALAQADARLETTSAQRIDIPTGQGRRAVAVRTHRLVLPFGQSPPLDLVLRHGERLQVSGRNGSGKSSLLRVLAGEVAPRAGEVRVGVRRLLLDQHFSLLDPDLSAQENLAKLAPGQASSHYRTLLAGIGLPGERAARHARQLSGGEQVKLALLALAATPEPYDLLLLDEPDNHLDDESRQLLASALHGYGGALVLVSHDDAFVDAVGVDRTLDLAPAAPDGT